MSSTQPPVSLTGLGMALQTVQDVPESVFDTLGSDSFYLRDLRQEDNCFKEIGIDFENAGLNIVKIQRLQNQMKWKAYKGQKDLLREQRSKFDAKFQINERYLYHGTAAEITDICELGLDDKLSGNGCFGKGIYFSDNPKKCTKYANRREGDEGLILCARVMLGDSKVYPKGQTDKKLLREPEKTGKVKGWRFYDSVQGCPKDFTEFVVYRAQNALIEYLITYSKSSLTKANHSASGGNITGPNKPKASTEQDLHQLQTPLSMSNTSQLSYESSKVVPNERRSPDHLVSTSSSQPSITVPKEDTSSSDSESDGEENEEATSSDEDDEIQTKSKKGNDEECTSSGSDTDSTEDLRNKKKDKNELYDSYGYAKREEMILSLKRRQFTELTGEYSEYLVETFLLASDFNVAQAVDMYHQKKKRDAQKLDKAAVEAEEDEQEEHVATRGKSEPDFVQGKTVPEFNSPQWNQLSEKDKEEVVNILVENFLAVTALSEAHASEARNILHVTHYNLDAAIVSYYESI